MQNHFFFGAVQLSGPQRGQTTELDLIGSNWNDSQSSSIAIDRNILLARGFKVGEKVTATLQPRYGYVIDDRAMQTSFVLTEAKNQDFILIIDDIACNRTNCLICARVINSVICPSHAAKGSTDCRIWIKMYLSELDKYGNHVRATEIVSQLDRNGKPPKKCVHLDVQERTSIVTARLHVAHSLGYPAEKMTCVPQSVEYQI